MAFKQARWWFAAAMISAAISVDASGAAQAGYTSNVQYCVRAYDGSSDCSYYSLQQCLAAVSGTGGDCAINPRFVGYPPAGPYRKQRRAYR